jgi:hypothetical protein
VKRCSFLSDVDRQIAAIDERLSQPTIAQKVMADEGFIERKAGEFLLREQNRKPREPLPAKTREESVGLVGFRGLGPLPGDSYIRRQTDPPGRMRARAMGLRGNEPLTERSSRLDAVQELLDYSLRKPGKRPGYSARSPAPLRPVGRAGAASPPAGAGTTFT